VQVNPDLETVLASPTDSSVETGNLSLHIRVPVVRVNSPVSDRNADVVETSCGDLLEVCLGVEVIPMTGEALQASTLSELSAEVVFVDGATGEERRCNPG
jgi:hypothetical protein